MSEKVVQFREELIAQRDEIVEQLRGEWEARLNWRVIIRGALKWAWIVFLFVLGLAVIASLFAFVINWILSTINLQEPIHMLVLYLVLYCIAVSFIAFAWSLGFQVYKHRRNPIIIHENRMDWGEGEPTDLHKLYSKMHEPFLNKSYLDGQTLLQPRVVEQLGFLSANCLERTIRPSQFERGDELIKMIENIASINDELEQLNQA
mgnify:CR=1 FL=1|tara:strand:+ start:396 stop:1010 length:615 start_codon:yes stop_codon:yes gene_type:complete